jgi:hypothetical protein
MEPERAATSVWSPAKRVLFRFAFVYLVLNILPFPVAALWETDPLSEAYNNLWKLSVPWVGRVLLHLPQEITIFPAGSGDTTFNYVQTLCFATLAAVATLVWTALAGKDASYERLLRWLRVYLRLYLGSTLITYGASKLIKAQFPDPLLLKLVQPIGDSSPMGLLWTFMGFSYAYNVFTGMGEALSGALLFTRRTTTAGALLGLGVLSHVVVLNFAYDVPVKLFSLHLLLMAVFLLGPDASRLVDFFLRGRPATPSPRPDLFEKPAWNRAARHLRSAFFVAAVGMSLFHSWQGAHQWGDLAPKPPLHGLYEVVEFSRDGEIRPPLVTDRARWKQLIIDRANFLAVVLMDGTVAYYDWKNEEEKKTLTLISRGPKPVESVLRYGEQRNELALEGSLGGAKVRMLLQKRPPNGFLLLRRGFHWVNEYPFNR